MQRYLVLLWHTSMSRKPELEDTAHVSSEEEAIDLVIRRSGWKYASRARAFLVDREFEEASTENWRYGVRCRPSGEISYTRRSKGQVQQQDFPADSLWTLL